MAQAIQSSGVHREALVLSSKHGAWCDGPLPAHLTEMLPPEYRGRGVGGFYPTSRGTLGRGVCIGGADAVRASLNRSLERLGTSYLEYAPLRSVGPTSFEDNSPPLRNSSKHHSAGSLRPPPFLTTVCRPPAASTRRCIVSRIHTASICYTGR